MSLVNARLKRKDFLEQLTAFADKCRQQIEADCAAFPSDPQASAERRARAQHDYKFFFYTYLPHYAKSPDASVFQDYAFAEFPKKIDHSEGALEVVAAPRGEAKSTIVSTGLALWCIVTDRKKFIGLLMDSGDQADMMLEAIKIELEDNPRLLMDYAEHCGQGRFWRIGQIVTKKNAIVKSGGMDKKLRGWRWGAQRPDLMLLDDLENDVNVKQKEQRDALEKKIDSVVLALGPPDGSMDVLYVGTTLHYDSVLQRKLKSPLWHGRCFSAIAQWPDRMDLWEKWEEILLNRGMEEADAFYASKKKAMDKGAVVSWPGTRPLLRLMKIRAQSHTTFDKEYQNKPTAGEDALFTSIQFWVQPCRHWIFFGAVDPSLGRNNKKNDPSAILVGGIDRETGILDVVEASIRRRVPDKIISDVILMEREYRCQIWGVEAVQFQEFLRTELVKRSAQLGIPVPARPIIPHADKALRIESLQPHFANGLIRLHRKLTTLYEQLANYPEADHDDGPDALEILWKLAAYGAGGVPKPLSRPSRASQQLRGRR